MFITAWGRFMRISEYTKVRSGVRDHNIAALSLNITDEGLGISFMSDKTSQASTYPQHRLVRWSFLPTRARLIMEDYKEIRPQVFHFFMKMDGQQVTRNDFINILDLCLLHMTYRFLSVVPHSFHTGGASTARLEGENILNICSDGRWGEKSSAIESYLQLNLISMTPEQIFEEKIHYRRQWSNTRLAYLARVMVQTVGSLAHPHTVLLNTYFPSFVVQYAHLLLTCYLGLVAAFKMQDQIRNRNSGVFLRGMKRLQECRE